MQTEQRSRNRALPLQVVLLVPFVLQIFGAVGLVGYLSFKNGQKAVNDLATQMIHKASQEVDEHLDTYLTLPVKLVQMNANAIAQGDVNLADPIAAGRYFWRQAKAFPDLTYIGFARTDGSEIGAGRWIRGIDVLVYENLPGQKAADYAADNHGNRGERLQQYDYNPLEESWYREPIAAGHLVWGQIEIAEDLDIELTAAGKSLQNPGNATQEGSGYYVASTVAAPVYAPQNTLLGVMSIDLSLTSISNFLRNFRVSSNGLVFVVERDGLLVGSSSPYPVFTGEGDRRSRVSSLSSPDPLIRTISQTLQQSQNQFYTIQSAQNQEIWFNGQRQFVQVTPWQNAHGLDWLVFVVVPESDFMAQVHANTRTTILLCFGALVVACLLGGVTSRWIARPILRLNQASEAIASGDLNQIVDTSSIRELNTLSHSFNHMAAQLRSSFVALEQGKAELEERVEERTAELQQTLAELQRTQAQMVQSEKMSSLGQLVAGIAHEINNPVNFIHGNLTYLKEHIQDLLRFVQLYQQFRNHAAREMQSAAEAIDLEFLQEDLPKMLASMQVGTERIQQIVLSLRNFSRMDEAEFKCVDIHAGLESTLLILQHRLKANNQRPEIEVRRDYGHLPLVECYAGQLNQVFMNILVNAIDALDKNHNPYPHRNLQKQPGCITIRTSVIDATWVTVAIANTGTEIPATIQPRIFDPFFTTKPVGRGTGMGLSISYQIITERHGGKLECYSSPETGTEFLIQIPLRQPV